MVPVLLAVGLSTVLVRLLDITLSPLTTVGGPLVVATCAEFSVLLVARRFAVLMFSSLPLLADFGMVVSINIAVAVLAALVVIPPLVMEADRRGWLRIGTVPASRPPHIWIHSANPTRDRYTMRSRDRISQAASS